MTNWIEHVVEPRRLYVAWQAADQFANRFRWAVGELLVSGEDMALRYFDEGTEFAAVNQGKSYDEISALGYGGYPAFSLRKRFHSVGVADAFMRRLPPRSRPDFSAYREQFRLRSDVQISDASLLAVTEAKLPSDGFSVVDPYESGAPSYDLMMEVAGYRYYSPHASPLMTTGRMVDIVEENENPHDPMAVQFTIAGTKVGNVNRLQASAFRKWLLESSVTAVVERMNGKPDHPRAYVFVRIRPRQSAKAA